MIVEKVVDNYANGTKITHLDELFFDLCTT